MESGREKARWAVTTLLLGFVLCLPITVILAPTGLFDSDSPVEGAIILALASVGAILLRRHWESVRAWFAKADDWSHEHPAFTFASYVLAGIYLGLLWHSFGIMILSVSLWGLLGWSHIRSDRRRRGDAAT